MAQQVQEEGGWPLGLQPLNNAVGSISFRMALITASSSASSSSSSSDLETEKSTGSFFHDESVTLGRLMGVHSLMELSRRSIRGGNTSERVLLTSQNNQKHNTRTFFSSLCSKSKSTQIIHNSRPRAAASHHNSYAHIISRTPPSNRDKSRSSKP